MRWAIEYGDRGAWFEALEAETGQTPAALLRKPEIPFDLAFYWRAFWRLSSRRGATFDVQPISMESILSYAVLLGVESYEEREQMLDLIVAMDIAFLEAIRDRRPGGKK